MSHGSPELDEDAAKLTAMGQDPGPELHQLDTTDLLDAFLIRIAALEAERDKELNYRRISEHERQVVVDLANSLAAQLDEARAQADRFTYALNWIAEDEKTYTGYGNYDEAAHSGEECQRIARAALTADDDPWNRCPSTHCERAQECRSPNECSAKPFPSFSTRIAAARAQAFEECEKIVTLHFFNERGFDEIIDAIHARAALSARQDADK
jgi:hypothetical protein